MDSVPEAFAVGVPLSRVLPAPQRQEDPGTLGALALMRRALGRVWAGRGGACVPGELVRPATPCCRSLVSTWAHGWGPGRPFRRGLPGWPPQGRQLLRGQLERDWGSPDVADQLLSPRSRGKGKNHEPSQPGPMQSPSPQAGHPAFLAAQRARRLPRARGGQGHPAPSAARVSTPSPDAFTLSTGHEPSPVLGTGKGLSLLRPQSRCRAGEQRRQVQRAWGGGRTAIGVEGCLGRSRREAEEECGWRQGLRGGCAGRDRKRR